MTFYAAYYIIGSIFFGVFSNVRCELLGDVDLIILPPVNQGYQMNALQQLTRSGRMEIHPAPTRRLETYDVLIPFDFKTEPSCPNSKYMVNLISMEMTYFVCGLLFAGVVEECVWDYAITVTLIHIAVTSIVMAEFPLVWHWWLALGCALTIMICSGHLLVHFAFQDNLIYPLLDDF